MKQRLLISAGALALAGSLIAATPGTNLVNENNLDVDWFTADTRPGGAIAFTNDHGAPAGFGDGALQLTTDETTAAKAQLMTDQFVGVPLADVTELAYWTYRADGPDEGAPSFQLQIDIDGVLDDGAGFTTLVFEPYWQNESGDPAPLAGSTWQNWDVDAGFFWSSGTAGDLQAGYGGPPLYTISEVLGLHPSAVVLGVGVSIGTYNPGYVVASDGLVFGTADGVYTFDFGPRPFTKDDCKNDGWKSNFETDQFKNQGDCVSYFASDGKTHGE